MTATASLPQFHYFSTGPSIGYCTLHGSYVGYSCPTCSTIVYPPNPIYPPQTITTITPAPVSTEDALAATVTALCNVISSLQEQLAERDRRIKELEDDARDSFNGR